MAGAGSAPSLPLPTPARSFVSVEYPGIVTASHSSVESALDTLGGLSKISKRLAAATQAEQVIEMDFSEPSSSKGFNFVHVVPAATVNTSNIIIKVTRRKRKVRQRNGPNEDARVDIQGRPFVDLKGMADFQYLPKIDNDPYVNLAKSLHNMDVKGIRAFKFAPLGEDFDADDLNMFPPPIFSRQELPHQYDFKPALSTTAVTKFNAQGEEITRLISKSRYKTTSALAISFYDHGPVPTEPSPLCKPVTVSHEVALLEKVKKLLQEKPMWTRLAMVNNLSSEDGKRLSNTAKQIVGLSSYTFSDGPFRELVIRFGYDPREEEESRQYQRLMLRVVNPIGISSRRRVMRESTAITAEDASAEPRSSHIFDGRTAHREIGNYQLCDISDPLLRQLLDDPKWHTNFCNERGGWYLPQFIENFREILRHKFVGLLKGRIVPDTECTEAVDRLPDERAVLAEKRALKAEVMRNRPLAPLQGADPGGESFVRPEARLNHAKRPRATSRPQQVQRAEGEDFEFTQSAAQESAAGREPATASPSALTTSAPSTSAPPQQIVLGAPSETLIIREKASQPSSNSLRKTVMAKPSKKPKHKQTRRRQGNDDDDGEDESVDMSE